MNWNTIFSGVGCVIITCVINHFRNNSKSQLKIDGNTMNTIPVIQKIASDSKSLYRKNNISNSDKRQISYDLILLNIISLHVLSHSLNKKLLRSNCNQSLNWIFDYLNVSCYNNLLLNYNYVVNDFNRAYKKIFRFHRRHDKYEIDFK